MPAVKAPQDFATGLLFILIGAAGLWLGRAWPMGTLALMDSGFFPRVLSGIVLASGLVLAIRSFVVNGPPLPGWGWRPLIGVTLAVIVFALAVERLGLVLTILATIGIGGFAGVPLRPIPFVALGAALSLGCVAIFIWGVELPLRIWPF